jgi:tetratricopeptide (TPR) repeat protein
MMTDEQQELVEKCTVYVSVGQGHGTGFFVAPGRVLTCEHVVRHLPDAQLLFVTWSGKKFQAKVERPKSEFDLALLQLNEPIPEHPCAFIGENPNIDDFLYSFGYPNDFQGDPVTFRYEGLSTTRDGQKLLKLKQGQAAEGLSGAALLNCRAGRVCGVMKGSRDVLADLGGRAIPTKSIFSAFNDLLDLQKDFHAIHSNWKRAFFAVDPSCRDGSIGLREVLNFIFSQFKRQDKGDNEPGPLDFKSHIQEDIVLCSLTPEQALAEVEAWVAEAENGDNDSDLASAAFYRNNFGKAAKLSGQTGESKLARLQDLRREEVERSKEIKRLTVEIVADFRRSGDALYLHYRFAEALESYKKALAQVNRNDEPAIWAATLVDAGMAHSALGIRVAGEAAHEHLAAAVTCDRKALEVFTREQFPQDWARTQNNLGIALKEQALLTAGDDAAALLAQAVQAYRNALQVYTRERFPQDWAMTQKNLGNALKEQALRTAGDDAAALLAQAVEAYRNALQVYTREQFPQAWARTQNNLGGALKEQALRTAGEDTAALLAQAVEACRNALQVYTRERFPQDWAMTQNNLGIALKEQGLRTAGDDAAALLAQAVEAYRNALQLRTREQFPRAWAMTQNNLGSALKEQALRTAGGDAATLLAQAVEACSNALQVRTREQFPQAWAMTQDNLGNALKEQALRTAGDDAAAAALLAQAVEAYRNALQVYTRERFPQDWARTQNNLGSALKEQAPRTAGDDAAALLAQAVEAYRNALQVFSERDFPLFHEIIRLNLEDAALHLAAYEH